MVEDGGLWWKLKMKPVTVSVCIPVFNCRRHIVQAVDSVLQQTFTDFELIIIDNCSE